MKTICFVTGNAEKVKEVSAILKEYGLAVVHEKIDYPEDKEASMEEVAKKASKEIAEQLGKPVMVDDTGMFFHAYTNFPGAMPKFVFKGIGYDGIFRLLAGKDRTAHFETAVGYCEPGGEPVTFAGIAQGMITEDVQGEDDPYMPYDRIFIADGESTVNTLLTLEEKNGPSQRAKAVRKLGEYLQNKSS